MCILKADQRGGWFCADHNRPATAAAGGDACIGWNASISTAGIEAQQYRSRRFLDETGRDGKEAGHAGKEDCPYRGHAGMQEAS